MVLECSIQYSGWCRSEYCIAQIIGVAKAQPNTQWGNAYISLILYPVLKCRVHYTKPWVTWDSQLTPSWLPVDSQWTLRGVSGPRVGVLMLQQYCPGTPSGLPVDSHGSPRDFHRTSWIELGVPHQDFVGVSWESTGSPLGVHRDSLVTFNHIYLYLI